MWCLLIFVSATVPLLSHAQTDAAQTHHVQLNVVRIAPGLRCINNIIDAIKSKSIGSCILYGMLISNCHAVNYNIMDHTCQVIASHEVVMQTQRSSVSLLASFYNNRDFLHTDVEKSRGRFKNTYELLNLRALKISKLHKNHIFQCMGKIFCVEFQRVPLKFHTKYLTHTLKDVDFIHIWKFKSSLI